MRVLVVNAGSSSLKLRVLDGDDALVLSRDLPALGAPDDAAVVGGALAEVDGLDAIGHRVVHGGAEFTDPTVVDERVMGHIAALTSLAPLHQPKALAGIKAVAAALPGVPAVACFDTAFHARLPAAAATYALPREWRERWGLRRFGFHGLSHAYASRRAAELLGRPLGDLRVVSCHLGAGASLAAIAAGRSVDTTMGFTPLDGLVMATRAGSMDPGIPLWLQEHGGLTAEELSSGLTNRAGVFGLAGTADMKAVIERARAGDEQAVLALDVYLHRLRAWIAAMTASLGGLDALVFTGGVGERAPLIRQRTVGRLAFLGLSLDESLNADGAPDRLISRPGSPAAILVVEAREDLEIAREVRQVLDDRRAGMRA